MAMVTEWTFTQKGRKTEAQRTMMLFTDEEPSEEDQQTWQDLANFLVDLVLKPKVEDKRVSLIER